jgi:hypothetical protein
MSEEWQYPCEPIFTHLFVEDQMRANAERGKKAQAFDTPFRYSDSGKCARAMAYSALGYDGEPFDAAGTFVTGIGTMVHEQVQEAIANVYPDSTFEIPTQVATSSGHCDGVIVTETHGRVLYELKTMNGTAFKQTSGIKTRPPKIENPTGPRWSTVLQSALNAKANDCEWICVGHIGLEAVSKGIAGQMEMSEMRRFISEFWIPKEVWEPLADQEIARQLNIIDHLDAGELPERFAIDDKGMEISLSPEGAKQDWRCQYCSYSESCINDGPGVVQIGMNQ